MLVWEILNSAEIHNIQLKLNENLTYNINLDSNTLYVDSNMEIFFHGKTTFNLDAHKPGDIDDVGSILSPIFSAIQEGT